MDSRCTKWPSTLLLHSAERWVLGSFYVLASVFAVFGNLLVIIAVLSKRSLRTRSYILLVNLCFADLAVGCLALPLAAVVMLVEVRSKSSCALDYTVGFVTCLSCSASVYLLTVISYDRYIKITRFEKYVQIMSPNKMTVLIAASWTLSVALAVMFISDIRQIYIDGTLVFSAFICFVATIIFYWNIFRRVSTQSSNILRWKIRSCRKAEADSTVAFRAVINKKIKGAGRSKESSSNQSPSNWATRREREKSQIKSSVEVAKTFIIIIFTFVASWTPFLVVLTLRSIRPQVKAGNGYASAYHWTLLVSLTNSLVNPIIYNIKNRKVRLQVRKILRITNFVRDNNSRSVEK